MLRDASLPGYLNIVAEELRNLAAGGASHSELSSRAAKCPQGFIEAVDQMIDRICDEHTHTAVSQVFTILSTFAYTNVGGCSEEELQRLASVTTVAWCRLRCDIRSYLSVYFSEEPCGSLQLVAVMNRTVADQATKRFLPFANASRSRANLLSRASLGVVRFRCCSC